jgi:hypothetical protein
MNKSNIIQQLVKECLTEKKQKEFSVKQKLKESLKRVIKKVLVEMNSSIPVKNDQEEENKIQKGYDKKGNVRIDKPNEKLLDELEKLVNGINEKFKVILDDNDDFTVDARELGKIRICPRWENNFDIEFYTKMQDRVRVIGATWDQAKDFVKANLKTEMKTKVDAAYKKSMDNLKDQTDKAVSELPQTDKLTQKNIGDTKKEDKDYNEFDQNDDDLPDKPMKEVKVEDRNKNIKETPKVKPPKHKNDKKLVVKDKKTSKFKR